MELFLSIRSSPYVLLRMRVMQGGVSQQGKCIQDKKGILLEGMLLSDCCSSSTEKFPTYSLTYFSAHSSEKAF